MKKESNNQKSNSRDVDWSKKEPKVRGQIIDGSNTPKPKPPKPDIK